MWLGCSAATLMKAAMRNIYFKLAIWNGPLNCWRDGKRAYATEADAKADVTTAGRYRISTVTSEGRIDGEPFEIGINRLGCDVAAANRHKRPAQSLYAARPLSGRPH
jgi:hypothetical protein